MLDEMKEVKGDGTEIDASDKRFSQSWVIDVVDDDFTFNPYILLHIIIKMSIFFSIIQTINEEKLKLKEKN